MRYIGYGVRSLLGFFVMLVAWGVFVEPRLILDVEEEVATIPGLPSGWEGQRVGVIADMQVGMWLGNTGMARRMIDELIERRPAAVLIAGDFVYKAGQDSTDELGTVVGLVRALPESGIPTYAVLGNHDYAMVRPDGDQDHELARRVRLALESAGLRVLENEAIPLDLLMRGGDPRGGQPLYLLGTGAAWPGLGSPLLALDDLPDDSPRLALMHNPDTFAEFPSGTAPFAVAGHTHGGQVRLPFTPEWTWMTFAKEDRVHADGWIDGYGAAENRLYVNRGIGFSVLPIRFNCPPELTIFTLQRSQP